MVKKAERSTLLSIDDLLSEFDAVHTRGGSVQGFAVNPLSSVDFVTILDSLGYETKPPKNFGFNKRNIHFATACRQSAKELRSPEDDGMVRIYSSPPSSCCEIELAYAERPFDLPAAQRSSRSRAVSHVTVPVSNFGVLGRKLLRRTSCRG